MEKDKLNKANELSKKIETIKGQIKQISFSQIEEFVPRKIYLSFNGSEEGLYAPESLFKVITKLVLVEHQLELIKLEKEFKEL